MILVHIHILDGIICVTRDDHVAKVCVYGGDHVADMLLLTGGAYPGLISMNRHLIFREADIAVSNGAVLVDDRNATDGAVTGLNVSKRRRG